MSLPPPDGQSFDSLKPKTDLDLFFTLAPDPLCVIRNDGYFERLNPAWEKILGFTQAELMAQPWLDFVHPDDRILALNAFQHCQQEPDPAPQSRRESDSPHPPDPSAHNFEARYRCVNAAYKRFRWSIHRHGQTNQIYGLLQEVVDHHHETFWRLMIQSVQDYAIYILDSQGRITSWNRGAEKIFGYSERQMLGQSFACLYTTAEQDAGKPAQDLQRVLEADHFEDEGYRIRGNGAHFWVRETLTTLREANGTLLGLLSLNQDITDRKQAEAQLLHNAFHDSLTGLPNIALFKTRLTHVFELSHQNPGYLFAVMFLDLDRFKVINDSLGHLIGDQLLIEISHRLRQCVRCGDTVARFGGDEFAILLENITTITNATEIADRIHQSLTQPFHLAGHEIFTSPSTGIALNNLDHDHAEAFLRDADTAMYRAKALGRGRYEVFDEIMHTQAFTLLQVENDLRHAMERGELEIFYQPIVPLRHEKVTGFEALLRWNHPTRGLVGPNEFIPVAEETGLIVAIGHWVLQEACRQVRQWQVQFNLDSAITISVNVSGRQFEQRDLVPKIKQVLEETGLDAHSLKLEITESVILGNAELVASMLLQLQAIGVRVSIDDFGTGYSSLSYLHRFPIDTIKIDSSFINRVDVDGDKLELVRTIIKLAWNLGMDVVAEGVETAKQLAQLKALQCEAVQGYYFSKPMNSHDAEAWIVQQNP